MTVTALDILKAAREYAADPDHIVMDSNSVYETADGSIAHAGNATRGCLLGIEGIIATRLGLGDHDTKGSLSIALQLTVAAHEPERSSGRIVEQGQAAMLAVYDKAIASLEAKS